jgi:hypothetical protein
MRIVQTACLFALVGVVVANPKHVTAQQQWSPEQQEVWDAEMACLNSHVDPIDLPARKACVHPDFMGWGVQGPVPLGYSEKAFDYYWTHNTVKSEEARPLHILVEGDIAVIQLMLRTVSSHDGGPDEESWVAWTDIMHRDNGKWSWIADHGHVPGGSN